MKFLSSKLSLLFFFLPLAILLSCKGEPQVEKRVRPVKTIKLGDSKSIESRTFTGRAEAAREVNLAFRVSGPLISLPVNVGQRVKKGVLIARIDPRDFEINLRSIRNAKKEAMAKLKAMKTGAREEDIKALEAQLASADAKQKEIVQNYKRANKLYKKGIIAEAGYDKALAARDAANAEIEAIRQNLKKAKTGARAEDIEAMEAQIKRLGAQLDAAKAALGDTLLRAPFTGHVAEKYVENYQTVRAQQPIVKLEDHSRIEVTFGVPEELISARKYVTRIVCRFEAFSGKEFEANSKEFSTEASRETGTYPVTVVMDQPDDIEILPGMAAEVQAFAEFPSDSDKIGFEVPPEAIFSDSSGKQFAWVVDEKTFTVHKREVQLGNFTSYGIKVQKGLKIRERIVTAGVHFLREGQKVRLMKTSSLNGAY